jgi:SAM-dependent methyltransferase
MIETIKSTLKARLNPDTVTYNGLSWLYGLLARKPGVRRAARMRLFKDSRFDASELFMASSLPSNLLDTVLDRFQPRSFLDVGCGTGRTLEHVARRGIECVGVEGSTDAIEASPVKHLIRRLNLNKPIDLGRRFDCVWSFEVAEHIHPVYTDVFLSTLVRHGDRIVLSAAHPGQGGAGHFNEQPPEYWIDRMKKLGFQCDRALTDQLHALPDQFSENVMVFVREGIGDG